MKEKLAEWLLVIQGYRKFLIALLIIVVSIVFRSNNLLSGVEFVDLVKSIGLGFLGTNSAEGLISVLKEHLSARRDAGNLLAPPGDKSKQTEDEEVEIIPAGDAK